MTDLASNDLDKLLGEMAQKKPAVPADLMARVLIDATHVQPVGVARPGLWASLLDLIGGWPAVGGLTMAGMAGIWIGFAPPAGLETMTNSVLESTQTVDLFGNDMLSSFSDEADG